MDLAYGLFTLDSNLFTGTFPWGNLSSKTNVTESASAPAVVTLA